jgi:hypothetical protein
LGIKRVGLNTLWIDSNEGQSLSGILKYPIAPLVDARPMAEMVADVLQVIKNYRP